MRYVVIVANKGSVVDSGVTSLPSPLVRGMPLPRRVELKLNQPLAVGVSFVPTAYFLALHDERGNSRTKTSSAPLSLVHH